MFANEFALHDLERTDSPNVPSTCLKDGSSSSGSFPATSKTSWQIIFCKSCCKLWYE